MEAPLTLFPSSSGEDREDDLRRLLRRRLLTLMLAGLAAFSLTTWTFVRWDGLLGRWTPAPGPAAVVRAQLDALDRGDLRRAYEQFSPHYREGVSFEAFHSLVVTHWGMFQTRKLEISDPEESEGRVVLWTRTLTREGDHYVAQFTLVRFDGRWWVDDLRWGEDDEGDEETLA
jgi:hypothetical protein